MAPPRDGYGRERGGVVVSRFEDEDGIDGPFERAMARAMREDANLAALRIMARRIRVILLNGSTEASDEIDSYETTIGEFIATPVTGFFDEGSAEDLTDLEIGQSFRVGSHGTKPETYRGPVCITRLPDMAVRS